MQTNNTAMYIVQQKYHILIVDDDASIGESLREIFGEIGFYYAEVAEDPLEGLHKLRNERYDMVFSDIMMPKINGLQLCDELCKEEKTGRIPKIIISASNGISKIEQPEKYCIRYLMTKPFNTKELLEKVNEALSI